MIEKVVDCVWNVMAHAQNPDFVFRRNGRVHLNRQGRQYSRLLAAEVCASAVVMLDTPCSEVVWTVLATHSIRQFPLHFPSRASPCAITFQLDSTYICCWILNVESQMIITVFLYEDQHAETVHYKGQGLIAVIKVKWLFRYVFKRIMVSHIEA